MHLSATVCYCWWVKSQWFSVKKRGHFEGRTLRRTISSQGDEFHEDRLEEGGSLRGASWRSVSKQFRSLHGKNARCSRFMWSLLRYLALAFGKSFWWEMEQLLMSSALTFMAVSVGKQRVLNHQHFGVPYFETNQTNPNVHLCQPNLLELNNGWSKWIGSEGTMVKNSTKMVAPKMYPRSSLFS